METPADAMAETGSVAASDAPSSVAVSNAASTLHGANPAQLAWARGLTARQKTMVKARTRDAAEIAARHKNILLFFGGVFMMHWKGDELAC